MNSLLLNKKTKKKSSRTAEKVCSTEETTIISEAGCYIKYQRETRLQHTLLETKEILINNAIDAISDNEENFYDCKLATTPELEAISSKSLSFSPVGSFFSFTPQKKKIKSIKSCSGVLAKKKVLVSYTNSSLVDNHQGPSKKAAKNKVIPKTNEDNKENKVSNIKNHYEKLNGKRGEKPFAEINEIIDNLLDPKTLLKGFDHQNKNNDTLGNIDSSVSKICARRSIGQDASVKSVKVLRQLFSPITLKKKDNHLQNKICARNKNEPVPKIFLD